MTIAYDFNEQKKSGAYGERYLDDFFSRWYAITPAAMRRAEFIKKAI